MFDSGYQKEILEVIDLIKGKKAFIEEFIKKNNGQTGKSKPTEEKCDSCEQYIFKKEIKDYSGEIGFKQAVIECISNMKADYSSEIAEYILQREGPDRVPSLFLDLFFYIATV